MTGRIGKNKPATFNREEAVADVDGNAPCTCSAARQTRPKLVQTRATHSRVLPEIPNAPNHRRPISHLGTLRAHRAFIRWKEQNMDTEVHRTTDEARAGSTPHIVRYVLSISLTLAVIVLGIILLWGFRP